MVNANFGFPQAFLFPFSGNVQLEFSDRLLILKEKTCCLTYLVMATGFLFSRAHHLLN